MSCPVRSPRPNPAAWRHRQRFQTPLKATSQPSGAGHLSPYPLWRQFPDRRRGHGLRHLQPFVLACAALAVDGKCLGGSARTDGKPLQLLSAVSHRLRLTVAREPIERKSNEIPALQPLLRKLPPAALEGSLITADAPHCQQESARFITQELGAD